jgi:hypothetical protein
VGGRVATPSDGIAERLGAIEPTSAKVAKPRSAGAPILDLPARDAGKYAHDLSDDGERVRRLSCELRAVRDPSTT